jgi:hypothetical protein
LIVYIAVAVALSVIPVLKALALRVVLVLTLIGALYRVDKEVGSAPLVVYLIVAPMVLQLIVTIFEVV